MVSIVRLFWDFLLLVNCIFSHSTWGIVADPMYKNEIQFTCHTSLGTI